MGERREDIGLDPIREAGPIDINLDDDDKRFLLKGKYMSKKTQTERLRQFFLSRGIKISGQELRRYERKPSEDDDSYISRLRNFPGDDEPTPSQSDDEGGNYVTALLWIGGILALMYVISRVK